MDGNGTLSVPNDLGVEVSLSFQQDDYTYPYLDGEFTAVKYWRLSTMRWEVWRERFAMGTTANPHSTRPKF